MSEIVMYDATPQGVDAIPADAKAVAGYVDGNYKSFPELVARFYPHAHIVSIGVFLGHLAEFTDVEQGNPINTPELVRADYEHRKAHGVWKPGYYGDTEHMHSVIIPGLTGVPDSDYRLWLAEWDGTNHIPPGYAAKQKSGGIRTSRGSFDVSVVDVQRFFPPEVHHKLLHKPHLPGKVKGVITRPHKKVAAGISTGGLATGIIALLNTQLHVHINGTEGAAIATAIASLMAAFAPNGYIGKPKP